MPIITPLHIAAGLIALLTGFTALCAPKAGALHRQSGRWFVLSMIIMGVTGAFIAALHGVESSVAAGILSAYLVITALTTMRRPRDWRVRADHAMTLIALITGTWALYLGVDIARSPHGVKHGIPSFPMFMFAFVAFISVVGDVRVARRAPRGNARLRRHLWRMCWALWIAAGSFFFGQTRHIPKPVRIPALLAMPPVFVVLAMLFWLWKTRSRKASRLTIAGSDRNESAAPAPFGADAA